MNTCKFIKIDNFFAKIIYIRKQTNAVVSKQSGHEINPRSTWTLAAKAICDSEQIKGSKIAIEEVSEAGTYLEATMNISG